MKRRAAKVCLILLEVTAALVAVIAASAVFLYWRVGRGPVQMGFLRSSAEFALERRLPAGFESEIGGMALARDAARGAYRVRLADVSIRDAAERQAARAETVDFTFAARDILSGRVGPRTVSANGAAFQVIRNAERALEVPAAPRRRKRRAFPVLAPLIDGGLLKSAFQRGEIADAQVTFLDVASGRSWTSNNAVIAITRSDSGIDAMMRADMRIEGKAASIDGKAIYAEQSGVIDASMSGRNFPIGDILTMFYGEDAAIVDAPASGQAEIRLTAGGAVERSRFLARIESGSLNIGERRAPIEFIEWDVQFDPQANAFALDRLAFDIAGNSGALEGAVTVTFGDDVRDPKTVGFNLAARALTVHLPGLFAGALPVDELTLAGDYDIEQDRFALNAFGARLLDTAVSGAVAVDFEPAAGAAPKRSPGVTAEIAIDGALDPERLLQLWPLTAGSGARDWIADRLAAATIENVEGAVDLPAGAVGADGRIPDEALTIAFDARDARAFYVKGMTPLTEASGSGTLRGNSFFMTVDRGRVGDVAISNGEVEFPTFIPKWQPAYFRFTADGKSEAMLGVLDQAPLRLLSKINLSPSQFVGDGSARVEITRPNKREVASDQYGYSGTARFENMRVTGLAGDAEFTNGVGSVALEPRSVTISATAELAEAPIDIVWRQNFFEQDGPSSIKLAGKVDSSTGDLFGVASRQFVRGPVGIEATAFGEIGAFEHIDLAADFSEAALSVEALDWSKAPGAAAFGEMQLVLSPEGVVARKIDLGGDGVSVSGNLAFRSDSSLKGGQIERLYLENAIDLSLTARRNEADVLDVTAVGNFLKAGPIVERVLEGAGGPGAAQGARSNWGTGVSVAARIARMTMRNDVAFTDATLDFWRDADRLHTLDFSASDANGAPLRIAMTPTGEDVGPSQIIEARSDAIGDVLSGVLGVTSISGGEGLMEIALGAPERKGLAGHIEARNLKVTKAPLLARIFSAGSLDGLNNLLNGKGIDLTYAYGEFAFAEGVLSVDDFRATGPSVGMTAEGAFTFGDGGKISLGGAVAPVYQLNSALGAAPIIGDILVGKKGEGIVALSYSVSGESDAPSVFVNPLSALTPGIFRGIMQPQRRTPSSVEAPAETAPEPELEPAPE